MAPKSVTAVAPKFVTKIPHRSMAGTTGAEARATIIFLTPLESNEPKHEIGSSVRRLTNGQIRPLHCTRAQRPHYTQQPASKPYPPDSMKFSPTQSERKKRSKTHPYPVDQQTNQAYDQTRRPLNVRIRDSEQRNRRRHQPHRTDQPRPKAVLSDPFPRPLLPPFFDHVVGNAARKRCTNFSHKKEGGGSQMAKFVSMWK